MVFWILATLTALIAVLTTASVLRAEGWWVRMADFPRLQLSLLGGGIVLAALLLLDLSAWPSWLVVLVAALCTGFQAWWIVPYTRLYPVEVQRAEPGRDRNRIRVMSANVLTPNRQADRLLEIIRKADPDVLVALETDQWWCDQLAVLYADYPYRVQCPQDNLYGMLVYSRLPLSDDALQFLVEDGVPSVHGLLTLPSGYQVELHCLHPAPPSPTENEYSTERDAELVVVGRSVAGSQYPVIVTGDLNDVAWSATTGLFRRISGLLDPRIGRGMFNSFHARYPFIRWPLDHFFHSDHFTLVGIHRLEPFGSDHFPIMVELALQPRRGARQETPITDAEDRAMAEAKVEEVDADAGDVHQPEGPAARRPPVSGD